MLWFFGCCVLEAFNNTAAMYISILTTPRSSENSVRKRARFGKSKTANLEYVARTSILEKLVLDHSNYTHIALGETCNDGRFVQNIDFGNPEKSEAGVESLQTT